MWLPLVQAGAGEERAGGARFQSGCQAVSAPEAHARMTSPPPWPAPAGGGNCRCRMWLPLVQAGAGEERAGGARFQSGCQAVSAPEAHARMTSPPPWPAPAGGGNCRCRMRLPLAQAGAGEERAGGARSHGIAPTLARPRWGRELPVPDEAPAGAGWCW